MVSYPKIYTFLIIVTFKYYVLCKYFKNLGLKDINVLDMVSYTKIYTFLITVTHMCKQF